MRKLTTFLLLCAAALVAQAPRRAPGFALFDSEMQVYDLYDYRGKIVVLEFMQTTCPHCASFADTLEQVEKKYGDKVQILAVVHAPDDNSNTVARFAAGHGVHYPILFDQGQMAYSYVRSGNLQFPHVYLIDAKGMIQGDYVYGLTTRDIFEGKGLFLEIDRLLGGKK
ncbi:MAG: TlpA family protein disulfide reductase [Bryobacteraceae bacterium]